jgi:hypothetical protein
MSAEAGRRIVGALFAGFLISGFASGATMLASGAAEPDDHDDAVVVTFTKWFTSDGFPWMTGVVGGATGPGSFAGEVIAVKDYGANCGSQASPGCLNFPFTLLDAIYKAQGSAHSFTALIRGGASDGTGRGTLNGAILDGWRTGASVHVEFQTLPTCSGNPAGPCFQGTIRIDQDASDCPATPFRPVAGAGSTRLL